MERIEFWKFIERARLGTKEAGMVASSFTNLLAGLPPSEIIAAERIYASLARDAYSWDLWGAAYVLNAGCSDDGFEYFRGWLVTQGQHVFETALVDPDSLAGVSTVTEASEDEVFECEEMLYAAGLAYEIAVGEPMPPQTTRQMPDLGRCWDFDDRHQIFSRIPRLGALRIS